MTGRRIFVFSMLAALATAGPAFAQSDFGRLAGSWTGEQTNSTGGRFRMVIEVSADGSYTWTREGRFVTGGRLSGSGNTLGYANQAGSRGSVVVSGRTLVWRNIHTGNDYVVTVRR
jgi:hypothetical protein